MKTLYLAAGALSLGLAACGDYSANEAAYNNETAAYAEGEGNYAGNAAGADYGSTATSSWPAGSRIVVEEGVTYRIGPDNVRVALGPDDSQIVVENGIRYRVDRAGRGCGSMTTAPRSGSTPMEWTRPSTRSEVQV